MGKLLIILLITILLTVLLTVSIGTFFVMFAIKRKDEFSAVILPEAEKEKLNEKRKTIIKENKDKFEIYTEEFTRKHPAEIRNIRSYDGLKLTAELHKADSHRYAVLIHGYKGNRSQMRNIAAVYGTWGYNTLLPDNRAHGESEGKWIGMGWLDKEDIVLWIETIINRDPEAEIILHGISMGGAAVMMASGLDLPCNVKAIIEDCGYTSAWDIFKDELKALYHLPSFPILYMYSVMSRCLAGYSPKTASSLKMLEKSKVPMLFIHGGDDNFVGTYMLSENFKAKIYGNKEIFTIEDAGHGEAYLRDPEEYFKRIHSFIEKQL